jgi:hypothetical protein
VGQDPGGVADKNSTVHPLPTAKAYLSAVGSELVLPLN